MEREAAWHLFKNSTKRKKKEDMAINFKGKETQEKKQRRGSYMQWNNKLLEQTGSEKTLKGKR